MGIISKIKGWFSKSSSSTSSKTQTNQTQTQKNQSTITSSGTSYTSGGSKGGGGVVYNPATGASTTNFGSPKKGSPTGVYATSTGGVSYQQNQTVVGTTPKTTTSGGSYSSGGGTESKPADLPSTPNVSTVKLDAPLAPGQQGPVRTEKDYVKQDIYQVTPGGKSYTAQQISATTPGYSLGWLTHPVETTKNYLQLKTGKISQEEYSTKMDIMEYQDIVSGRTFKYSQTPEGDVSATFNVQPEYGLTKNFMGTLTASPVVQFATAAGFAGVGLAIGSASAAATSFAVSYPTTFASKAITYGTTSNVGYMIASQANTALTTGFEYSLGRQVQQSYETSKATGSNPIYGYTETAAINLIGFAGFTSGLKAGSNVGLRFEGPINAGTQYYERGLYLKTGPQGEFPLITQRATGLGTTTTSMGETIITPISYGRVKFFNNAPSEFSPPTSRPMALFDYTSTPERWTNPKVAWSSQEYYPSGTYETVKFMKYTSKFGSPSDLDIFRGEFGAISKSYSKKVTFSKQISPEMISTQKDAPKGFGESMDEYVRSVYKKGVDISVGGSYAQQVQSAQTTKIGDKDFIIQGLPTKSKIQIARGGYEYLKSKGYNVFIKESPSTIQIGLVGAKGKPAFEFPIQEIAAAPYGFAYQNPIKVKGEAIPVQRLSQESVNLFA